MKVLRTLCAVAVMAGTAHAQSDDSWRWDGEVGRGQWMRVSNINGAITVSPSSDGLVHVTAVKKWRRGDPREVRIEVVQQGGNVTVCALWSLEMRCEIEGSRGSISRRRNQSNDTSVDFDVRLPAGARLAATTVNGSVRARGMTEEIIATTVNGGVDVETRGGPATATTVNGNIDIAVGSNANRGMKATTVNGSVAVRLPANAGADVSMTTVNGSITTDFPMTISGRWGPKSARGTIGGGGPDLQMTTVNGSLTLRREGSG